jgi:hypothetical protein
MNNYEKTVLRNLIIKIGRKPNRKKKEPLPPHERTEIWKNKILVFVLKHGFLNGDTFAEFEKKFKEGKIPKEYITKINLAMRRAENEKQKQYKKKT